MNTIVENTETNKFYESQFQIELAYEEQKIKNYAGAAELFSRAIEINDAAAEAYFGRAAANFVMNKKEAALADFITASAKDYKKAESLYYAARCALSTNNGEKADDFFNSFIQNPELIKSLCAPPADIKKLLEALVKDAAYFELAALHPFKNGTPVNENNFTADYLNELLSQTDLKIYKNPTAIDLFFQKGMIHIIKNEYIPAIKSIKGAEFLSLIKAAARNDSSIYAVFLSAVYLINYNFGRLIIIEDINENGLSASGASALVIFIYQLTREAVLYNANASSRERESSKKNGENISETRKIYNENGILLEKIKFKNGKRIHSINYNDDGSVKEGKFTETNPETQETSEVFYVNGQLEGCVKIYRHGAKSQKFLYSKNNYKNGRLHGKSQLFSESNPAFITTEFIYATGVLIEEINYSRAGASLEKRHEFYDNCKLIKTIEYKDNEILCIKEIEYNGLAAVEKIFKPGGPDGNYLKIIRNFFCDKLDGISRQYYPDGKTACETPYKKGFRNGYFLKYYKNGRLACAESYYDDDFEGIVARFDASGNLTNLKIYECDFDSQLKP